MPVTQHVPDMAIGVVDEQSCDRPKPALTEKKWYAGQIADGDCCVNDQGYR